MTERTELQTHPLLLRPYCVDEVWYHVLREEWEGRNRR